MHCKMTSPTPPPGLKDEKYENFSLHENSCNNFSYLQKGSMLCMQRIQSCCKEAGYRIGDFCLQN